MHDYSCMHQFNKLITMMQFNHSTFACCIVYLRTASPRCYVGIYAQLDIVFWSKMKSFSLVGDWWAGYGYEIPTLQRYALRILSQPCSSHWCCWNWSTFESIHGKKHSRTEPEKLNDLVFVHCNLWLQSISQNRDRKSKPVVFDEIDVSSEWPTELESLAPILDDSLLDSLPLNIEIVSDL